MFPLLLTVYSGLSPFTFSAPERAPVPENTSVFTRRCGISYLPCSRENSVLYGPRGESTPSNHQRPLFGGTPLSALSQRETRGDVPHSPAFYYITVRLSKPLMQGRTTPLAAEEVRPTCRGTSNRRRTCPPRKTKPVPDPPLISTTASTLTRVGCGIGRQRCFGDPEDDEGCSGVVASSTCVTKPQDPR